MDGLAAHLPHPVHYPTENQPRRQVKEKLNRRAAAATKPKAAPPHSPRGGNPNRQRAVNGSLPRHDAEHGGRHEEAAAATPNNAHNTQTPNRQAAAAAAADKKADRASKAQPQPKRTHPETQVEWVMGGCANQSLCRTPPR